MTQHGPQYPSSYYARRAARRLFERDGEVEIEEWGHVEDADGKAGVWVEGWLFVSDDEVRAEALIVAAEEAGVL